MTNNRQDTGKHQGEMQKSPLPDEKASLDEKPFKSFIDIDKVVNEYNNPSKDS